MFKTNCLLFNISFNLGRVLCRGMYGKLFSHLKMRHHMSCFCKLRNYSHRNILKLHERGMLQDMFPDNASNEIINLLNSGPQTVYAGFDPTADSLHIGNLLVLVHLLHWQRAGHNVIAVVGGATGQIGDPSGRTTERSTVASSLLKDNTLSLKKNIEQILFNHETYLWKRLGKKDVLPPIQILNNYNWYSGINVVEFVNRIGRNFRMGTMLSRHSVQSRLSSEAGMSFTEFCYQVFQAYDWFYLLDKYNCKFQIGGTDQMGNIMSGHDLISRVADVKVYGLTLPLITTESGNKFGKSAGNAVWLKAERSSPFQLYQFFVRSRDSEVERLLKLFTFESLGSIEELLQKHKMNPEQRLAQKKLAEQVTLLVHGEAGLQSALHATDALYNSDVTSLGQLSAQDIGLIFEGATIRELLMKPGTTTLQLSMEAGCFSAESDARRIISAGGFYLNHQRVTNTEEVLTPSVHILPNNVTLIRVGKKTYYVVKWCA